MRFLPKSTALELLDAGCGIGYHGLRLLSREHNITFIDVSPKMIEKVRFEVSKIKNNSKVSFLVLDIRNIKQISNCSFDAIISGGTVISDCGDPVQAIKELTRVLKENGILGFSVRNIDGPYQKSKRQEVVHDGGGGFDWWFFL